MAMDDAQDHEEKSVRDDVESSGEGFIGKLGEERTGAGRRERRCWKNSAGGKRRCGKSCNGGKGSEAENAGGLCAE